MYLLRPAREMNRPPGGGREDAVRKAEQPRVVPDGI